MKYVMESHNLSLSPTTKPFATLSLTVFFSKSYPKD